jgi:hypothetical protein
MSVDEDQESLPDGPPDKCPPEVTDGDRHELMQGAPSGFDPCSPEPTDDEGSQGSQGATTATFAQLVQPSDIVLVHELVGSMVPAAAQDLFQDNSGQDVAVLRNDLLARSKQDLWALWLHHQ